MASGKITRTDEYKVIKYGDKYWGIEYEDGQSTSYNWVDIHNAKKSYPMDGKYYLNKPEDATYKDSHYITELKKGKVITIRETSIYEEINE